MFCLFVANRSAGWFHNSHLTEKLRSIHKLKYNRDINKLLEEKRSLVVICKCHKSKVQEIKLGFLTQY